MAKRLKASSIATKLERRATVLYGRLRRHQRNCLVMKIAVILHKMVDPCTGLRKNRKCTGKREKYPKSWPIFPFLAPNSGFPVFASFPLHFSSQIPVRNMCHLDSPWTPYLILSHLLDVCARFRLKPNKESRNHDDSHFLTFYFIHEYVVQHY